jgi:hypothetical protein
MATLFASTVLAVGATPAQAGSIILTNPDQFAAGSTLVTFDEGDFSGHLLKPFEVVTSYRGIGFQAIGAPPNTWPQAAFDPTPPREFGPGGSAGGTIIQVQFPPDPVQGLQITLPFSVFQFGAEFLAVTPGDFTFRLFEGSQQVDLVTIPAGPIGQVYNFHAFQDSSAFDRVIVEGPGESAGDGRVIMDNLRYGPAASPEPSTMVLAGIGIVCIVGVAWRRHGTMARLWCCFGVRFRTWRPPFCGRLPQVFGFPAALSNADR